MRLILAALLAFWTPLAQAGEPSFDALSHLLHEYAGSVDEQAAAAVPEDDAPADSGTLLARIHADLTLMAGGFETFRHPSHAQRALQDLPDHIVPELRPFFKDRDSTLATLYRTLAVMDYTLAMRFPEPACAPQARRRALLASSDGLFTDPNGNLSAWLSRLLGPSSKGRTAEEALDRASSKQALSAAAYEQVRVKVAKITEALNSEKAVGKNRANLYCMRAEAFETLASAHQNALAGPVEVSRETGKANSPITEIASVLLIATDEGSSRFQAVGAGVVVETPTGPKILSDARLMPSEDGKLELHAISRSEDGSLKKPRKLIIERTDQSTHVMIARLAEENDIPALKIAQGIVGEHDLLRAVGHTSASGAWTVSQGLVTATGQGTFASDAILGPEMLGGPLLNDAGEVAGLVVLPPGGDSPSSVNPEQLRRVIGGGPPESDIQFIESRQTGSGAILTAAAPLSAPNGGGASPTYIYSQTQYGTVRGRCMNCSSADSSSGTAYSGKSAGTEIGEALAPLVQMLIFKGIPALFRKVGELFARKPKTAATGSRMQTKTAPANSSSTKTQEKPPAAPIKKKDPLKLTELTLEVVPNIGRAGSAVKLVARLALNDPEASKKDFVVTFHAKPESLVQFKGEPRAKTDSSGVATVTAILRDDHNVRPVKAGDTKAVRQKSKNAFGDLDAEMRAMDSDPSGVAEPEVEEHKDETVEFDGTATLGISLAATTMALIRGSEAPTEYEIDTSALIALTNNTAFEGVETPHPLEPEAPQILVFLQINRGNVFISPQALREYLEPVNRKTKERVPLTQQEIALRADILATNKIVAATPASEETVAKFAAARSAFRSPGDADILASAAEHKRILATTEKSHVEKYVAAVNAGLTLPDLKFLQFEKNLPPRLRPSFK